MDNSGNNDINCFFTLGCFLRNQDIIILGIMILMSKWDKMKRKIKQCKECGMRLASVNLADSLSA